jgi:nucleotide-binding universal stress UspA family protein
MKILLAYDGTLHAKKALVYGIGKASETMGELTVLHIFDRSLFVDYDAGPRAEEMAKAEADQRLAEAREIINEKATGINVRVVSAEGDAVRGVLDFVQASQTDLILAPPRFKAIVKSAPCPVYLIPGTILVPVDNTDSAASGIARIAQEAVASGSRVMLLGIVPIHLYSHEEKRELERVKKETVSAVKRLKKRLSERGIEASEAVRSGYPDEEILGAANEYSVSLIILPSGRTTPSELSKAASILLDEPGKLQWPLFLLPAEGAV